MIEQEIEVFIDCLENYFAKKSNEKVIVETPYLTDDISKSLLEFTGIISISGAYNGHIYFTAPAAFLERLLQLHNQSDFNENLMRDVIGEITNTLSGNSRRSLGSNFVISVPKVIQGDAQLASSFYTDHSYVVPLKWSDHIAALLVSISKV